MYSENKYGIKDIQEKLLEILIYFKDFCSKHNLNFVLAGGTCLGAVRNKGFIPWDDDLDVFMLREDYEKLGLLWEKYADTDRYSCVRSDDKINIHHAATEIKDNNTTFINYHTQDLDINHGLMIDVIPLDDVAKSKVLSCLQIPYAMMFSCFNFQRLPEHKGKLIYLITKIALSSIRSFDTRYKIWKYCENKMIKLGKNKSGFVASFIEGPTIMKQRFPKDWFYNPEHLDFEGQTMPVPREYDKWLRVSYGDYMTPPPEKERVLRHNIKFYDMNNSYKKYKGIYYCEK